jgi:single-strand DNA-binding protein
VFIEGRLVSDPATGGPRIWTGNDGKPHAAFSLRAITVQFLGSIGSAGQPPDEVKYGEAVTDDVPW